jgi:hypothetical protein
MEQEHRRPTDVSKDENTSDVPTSNKGVEPSAEHTSGQQGEKYSAKADATMRSSMMGLQEKMMKKSFADGINPRHSITDTTNVFP